jgi:sensory rhodopsin
MINTIFIIGLVVFSISSLYFYFNNKKDAGLNTAFLVSFVTLVSYTLMWQGNFVSESANGQPIYWTRWLFYAISCSLLMLEIARAKGINGSGEVTQLVFLNVIVMGTGTLAAISSGLPRWIFFILSSIAYIIQISSVLKASKANWINTYIFLGWTGFPIVFLLAPTGLAVFGSAIAMGLYLALDIYTKIIFNLQLKKKM